MQYNGYRDLKVYQGAYKLAMDIFQLTEIRKVLYKKQLMAFISFAPYSILLTSYSYET